MPTTNGLKLIKCITGGRVLYFLLFYLNSLLIIIIIQNISIFWTLQFYKNNAPLHLSFLIMLTRILAVNLHVMSPVYCGKITVIHDLEKIIALFKSLYTQESSQKHYLQHYHGLHVYPWPMRLRHGVSRGHDGGSQPGPVGARRRSRGHHHILLKWTAAGRPTGRNSVHYFSHSIAGRHGNPSGGFYSSITSGCMFITGQWHSWPSWRDSTWSTYESSKTIPTL